jgi:response regulator RpfG family c-di-GMP phosphodiesterase
MSSEAQPHPRILQPLTGDRRILVVDDEAFIREILRERLERAGFEVEEACEGNEALAALSCSPFSVLLTDINMNGMNGLDLLKESVRRFPDTAGVVMSAYAELNTAVAALRLGAYDYVTKPFNFDALLITIENAIRKKSLEIEVQEYRNHLERKVREQTDLINSMYVRSVDALIKALEAKDLYTRGHSQRVTMYSVAIGRLLGLPDEELEDLRRASILHDLGKIGVREAVLNKPSRLDGQEYGEITRHPETAVRILEPIPFFIPLLPAILHHHERYDGTGYPRGLSGEAVPLHSRIMAIADTFDAMTSTRAYRKALPLHEANAEIRRCSGSQFDPRLVPVFFECQGRIEVPSDTILPEGLEETIFLQANLRAL